MAHENTVLHSFETPDGAQCVDLFKRPDGSCGFETYRRDAEDARGWFATGSYSRLSVPSETAARKAAVSAVPWLAAIINSA
jgi:hypothetical protein